MKLKVTPTAIQNLCIGVVCVWAMTPQLAYSSVARLASLAAVAAWLLIELWRPRGILRAPTLPVLLVFFYSSYTIFFEFQTHGTGGVIGNIQLYIMLFFLLAQQARRREIESLYPVFWLVIGLSIVAMTTTLIFVSTVDARAMRVVVRSSTEAQELSEQGVGGYALAYSAVLVLPVLTLLSLRPVLIDYLHPPRVLRAIPALPKLVIWYLTALCLVVVVMSQYSTAVLSAAVTLSLTLILWRMSNLRLFLAVSAAIFIVFFGKALLIEIIAALLPFAEGSNYFNKLNDLMQLLVAGDVIGTADDRIERYLRSLSLFLGSPIYGVLFYDHVGKHSTLLDAFARWGAILGAVLVYLVSFVQLRALKACYKMPGGAGAAIGSLASVLIVFGLNKHFMAAGTIIFIVYPVVFFALKARLEPGERSWDGGVHA